MQPSRPTGSHPAAATAEPASAPRSCAGRAGAAAQFLSRYGVLLGFLVLWQVAQQRWAGSTRRSFRRSTRSSPRSGTGSPAAALLDDIAISLQRAGIAFAAAVAVAIPLGLFMGQVRAVETRARSDPAALPADLGAGALSGLHPAAGARRNLEDLRHLLGDAVSAAAQHHRRRQGSRSEADRDGARLWRRRG